MDNPINSMSEALSEKPRIGSPDDPQESGWTIYFEEFLSKSKEKHSSSKNDMGSSTSLVSDATSSAAKKLTGKALATSFSLGESWLHLPQQRFCSGKRKAGGALVEEDAFADTATSPVRSPKLKKECLHNHEGKGSTSCNHLVNEKTANGFKLQRQRQ